jgi:hypothetical protein
MSKSATEIDTLYAEVQRRMIENGEWDRWVFVLYSIIGYVLKFSRSDCCISCLLSCLKADGQMIFCTAPKVCPTVVVFVRLTSNQ